MTTEMNTAMTGPASELLRMEGGECALRKAGVWWLREREGGQEIVVWAVLPPDLA